jgi:DNA invertase Pin-like site-specific DNA recombinase
VASTALPPDGGYQKAKAEGRYKGWPASIDANTVRKLHDQGMLPAHIAKHLRIGRASVYRALDGAQAAV